MVFWVYLVSLKKCTRGIHFILLNGCVTASFQKHTGLFGLCVLYSIMFFSSTAFSLTIDITHYFLISFLGIHLVAQSFTLSTCNDVGL